MDNVRKILIVDALLATFYTKCVDMSVLISTREILSESAILFCSLMLGNFAETCYGVTVFAFHCYQ